MYKCGASLNSPPCLEGVSVVSTDGVVVHVKALTLFARRRESDAFYATIPVSTFKNLFCTAVRLQTTRQPRPSKSETLDIMILLNWCQVDIGIIGIKRSVIKKTNIRYPDNSFLIPDNNFQPPNNIIYLS